MNTPLYTMTEAEQASLQLLAKAITLAQVTVYQQNVELEKLKGNISATLRSVEAAEANLSGAVGFLFSSHDITEGRVAPDFSRITKE